MPTAYFGRKHEPGFDLELDADLIAVRTHSGRPISRSAHPVPTALTSALEDAALVVAYPEAGVEVYRLPSTPGAPGAGVRKTALRALPDVRFAGGVLVDPVSREPVLYTENLFVKFADTARPRACARILRDAGLVVRQQVAYAVNAFVAAAPDGTGQRVFDLAAGLLQRDDVEYSHPELIRPRARKRVYPQQWHLKATTVAGTAVDAHAHVEDAHRLTRGAGVRIAIVDDGIDVDHPEFKGRGKVEAPHDATLRTDDPRPQDPDPRFPEDHGTACAGVACANGAHGASGVAPKATLIPIRLSSGLGSQREADAFVWAADHGADVISCSWGPPDGRWWDPRDPMHQRVVPLPASTRLAIDYAVTKGRGGKGCVVLFAAGNGNELVEHDGYASYEKVTAVAACNDRGTRSVYSDRGRAVWCAFPSSDMGYEPFEHPEPLTPGIWTTDRVGLDGYNVGHRADGDAKGNYTNGFGGTSSACPGAAGVAALVLALAPALSWRAVKDVLAQACDRIDDAGGRYDPDTGHSMLYGYGRLNARRAVELARDRSRSPSAARRRGRAS